MRKSLIKFIKNLGRYLGVVALDHALKVWAQSKTTAGSVKVSPFLDWVAVWNQGISFGWMPLSSPWARGVFIILVLGIIIMLSLRLRPTSRWEAAAFFLIFSGGLANLMDRILWGAVFDFISIHYRHEIFFPAFNFADILITIGGVMIVLRMGKEWRNSLSSSA